VNSLSEAVRYAKLINRHNVKLVADIYHMREQQEPLSEIGVYKDWLAHVHLADTNRRNPGSGSYDYSTFFCQLNDARYAGRLTVECILEEPEREMKFSAAFLRRYVRA
jgi:sugar phosphate isomerase/epimerase